jgi:hypothetical protein
VWCGVVVSGRSGRCVLFFAAIVAAA